MFKVKKPRRCRAIKVIAFRKTSAKVICVYQSICRKEIRKKSGIGYIVNHDGMFMECSIDASPSKWWWFDSKRERKMANLLLEKEKRKVNQDMKGKKIGMKGGRWEQKLQQMRFSNETSRYYPLPGLTGRKEIQRKREKQEDLVIYQVRILTQSVTNRCRDSQGMKKENQGDKDCCPAEVYSCPSRCHPGHCSAYLSITSFTCETITKWWWWTEVHY